MKMLIAIVLTCLNVFSSYSQEQFDYLIERHRFNISLISDCFIDNDTIYVINPNEEFLSKFLGFIETKQGKKYFIVASSFFFDLQVSPKNENHIFLYDEKKNFVGYYYLSDYGQRPFKVLGHNLYIKDPDCSNTVIISFADGIPRFINLECNDKNSFYEFYTE